MTEYTKFHTVEAHEVKPGNILIEAPSETWSGGHFQAAHLVTEEDININEIVCVSTSQAHKPLNLTETPVAIIIRKGALMGVGNKSLKQLKQSLNIVKKCLI